MDPRTPVLVGWSQFTSREGESDPLDLMERVARDAAPDHLLRRIDAICVVDSVSLAVPDPGALVGERLGMGRPRLSLRTGLGGNSPQLAVNVLSERIARGALDCALVVGAEAMNTLMPYVKRGERPAWPTQDDGARADEVLAEDRPGNSDLENAAGLIAPIFVYPLLENALRRAAARSVDEQRELVQRLWSRFAEVARSNPHAWNPDPPEDLVAPTASNRLVSFPYTKLLNANIQVDQAAALLLCAHGVAPGEPRVYPLAGASASDEWFVSERSELHRSPAIRACWQALGTDIDTVAHLDVYSCFPSAVQIAGTELGYDPVGDSRPPTVTGGLTFAGGPGNAYVLHSIAAMADRLVAENGRGPATGLVTALGWYVTKHALGTYSTFPPSSPFRHVRPDVEPARREATLDAGTATVESYTALFERDGSPGMGIVSALRPDGRRALAKSHDPEALGALLGEDALGRAVELAGGGEGFTLN